jgi:hypothetical protein
MRQGPSAPCPVRRTPVRTAPARRDPDPAGFQTPTESPVAWVREAAWLFTLEGRGRQGLPATVEDAPTISAVAALLRLPHQGMRSAPAGPSQSGVGCSSNGRR